MDEGLATATVEATGKRPRTIYAITRSGRSELLASYVALALRRTGARDTSSSVSDPQPPSPASGRRGSKR